MAKHIRDTILVLINKDQSTIRNDYILKAIKRDEFYSIQLAYDDSNSINPNQSHKESILAAFDRVRPKCWISGTKFINKVDCIQVSVMFHSNLAYDLYVAIEPSPYKYI